MLGRQFPVLHAIRRLECPESIPWEALDEVWAMRIHDQTLEQLAERGGLDPTEIVINIRHLEWSDGYALSEDECVQVLKNLVAEIPK